MIRRFLTRILMVILVAACGYNAWQVRQLQEQVQWLQSHVGQVRVIGGTPPQNDSAHVDQSWLAQADLHAARARAAVLRADLPTAQHELQRGVDDVHRAVQGPEERTQGALQQARHTLTTLQNQADSLWRKVHSVSPGP